MDDKFISSCHPLSEDHGRPGAGRVGTVPWHKTGKAPAAHGVNSRGQQKEGEGTVVCPDVKRLLTRSQRFLPFSSTTI